MRYDRRPDRAIEQMLRRGVAAAEGSPTDACVDGETLAAWSSGALKSADSVRVEAHIADCARCQSMLAAFVRTAPVTAAAAPWWQRTQVRWLVPLATAATVAAIWVAVPQREQSGTESRETTFSADAERVTPSAPERPPSPSVQNAPGSRQQPAPSTGQQSAPGASLKREPARDAAAPADSLQRREKLGQTAAAQVGRGAADEQAAAAPPGAAPARPPVAAPAAPRPPSDSVAESAAERPAFMARAAVPEIISPGGSTRWRIVAGGQVQRSAGASWEAVALPLEATITSGHSPAASVAWLVGKGGVIFVTTDGTQFERVPFASSADLVSVVAVDDQQASVTTADGRVFHTVNRGVNWAQR